MPIDLERLRYSLKERVHGKHVPTGGSFSPVNVETYLEGLSTGKKEELVIIARVDGVIMMDARRMGFYSLHTSHNQFEQDPWQQDSYERIGWDTKLGLMAGIGRKEPMGYPELLRKMIIANLYLPNIVIGFMDDELENAMDLPVSREEIGTLPELLSKDQKRLARSWLLEAEQTAITYPTVIGEYLEAARKFAIVGNLDDLNFDQQAAILETLHHRSSLNRDLELAEEAKRSRKSQETVGDFALRALKHAVWLGEDTSAFEVYADKEVDRLLNFILKKPSEFEGFTQAELTAARWRDWAGAVQLWLKVSGRDETRRLAEIKKRLEDNERLGLRKIRGVPPIDF